MSANSAIAYSAHAVLPERTSAWATSASIVLADLLALSSIYWFAVLGRYLLTPRYDLHFYLELYPVIALFLGTFYTQNLYPGVLLHPVEEIRRVFKGVTVVFLVIALGTFLWRNADAYSRSVFLIIWASGAPSVLLARHAVRHIFSKFAWWGFPAVILGSGPCARRVIQSFRQSKRGVRVAGVLSNDPIHTSDPDFPPTLGPLAAGPLVAASRRALYAVVAMSDKSNQEIRYVIQHFCRGFRHVLLVPDMPAVCSLGISAFDIGGEVGLELPQRLLHTADRLLKRLLDLLLSAVIILFLAPLFFLLALAICSTSQGPVFFGHSRYGRNGKLFKALKFRTMAHNSAEILAAHLKQFPECQEEWNRDHKLRSDPRITAVGRWLRRYSLDELPQLLNVFIGQMSLVGPRPIVQSEISKYGEGYELYTRVHPGITGLWQVSGRNNTTYQERVAFDEYYVRNWSVWLDAYILARTVKVVITADGAY